jgi:hypothetical protein
MSTTSNAPTPQLPPTGVFDDPLSNWGNDDLLLQSETRVHAQQRSPAEFRVLDWPELRELFELYDREANQHKPKARSFGVSTIVIVTLGLVFSAVAPLVAKWSPGLQLPLSVCGGVLVAIGAGLALAHWLGSRSKERWLAYRFCTERLRQFYFQFVINHLDQGVAAMHDDAQLAAYQAHRSRSLGDFRRSMEHSPGTRWRELADDEGAVEFWLNSAWPLEPTMIGGQGLDDLLGVLKRQRIGIQREYAMRRIAKNNTHTPGFRARLVMLAADSMTLSLPVIALVSALLLWFGSVTPDTTAIILGLAVLQSGFGAMIAGLRALDQGLRWSEDDKRYRWYARKMTDLGHRFDRAHSPAAKLAALREAEYLAYDEMRDFLMSHKSARFWF